MTISSLEMQRNESIPPAEMGVAAPALVLSRPPDEMQAEAELLASSVGNATRIDLDYILGGNNHCLWAVVNNKSYYAWMNNEVVQAIVEPAFAAGTVSIQFNANSQIERIRPIRTF